MSWNQRLHFTEESFRSHVYEVARQTMKGLRTSPVNGICYLPYWWVNKEIRVFWEEGISQETVNTIVSAIDKRLREIGFKFRFVLIRSHKSSQNQVSSALIKGCLDYEKLFLTALSEQWRDELHGGYQHADVYITNRSFYNDNSSWGAASFIEGAMVFCLHGHRQQQSSFLYKVALHETTHLLGMYCHCDDYQNVAGLQYTPECNMHYSCSYEKLCPKCQKQLNAWWQGVSDEVKSNAK